MIASGASIPRARLRLIDLVAGYFELNGVLCGIGSAYAWLTLLSSALLPFTGAHRHGWS